MYLFCLNYLGENQVGISGHMLIHHTTVYDHEAAIRIQFFCDSKIIHQVWYKKIMKEHIKGSHVILPCYHFWYCNFMIWTLFWCNTSPVLSKDPCKHVWWCSIGMVNHRRWEWRHKNNVVIWHLVSMNIYIFVVTVLAPNYFLNEIPEHAWNSFFKNITSKHSLKIIWSFTIGACGSYGV